MYPASMQVFACELRDFHLTPALLSDTGIHTTSPRFPAELSRIDAIRTHGPFRHVDVHEIGAFFGFPSSLTGAASDLLAF